MTDNIRSMSRSMNVEEVDSESREREISDKMGVRSCYIKSVIFLNVLTGLVCIRLM
jgi:hypothetical protein